MTNPKLIAVLLIIIAGALIYLVINKSMKKKNFVHVTDMSHEWRHDDVFMETNSGEIFFLDVSTAKLKKTR